MLRKVYHVYLLLANNFLVISSSSTPVDNKQLFQARAEQNKNVPVSTSNIWLVRNDIPFTMYFSNFETQ